MNNIPTVFINSYVENLMAKAEGGYVTIRDGVYLMDNRSGDLDDESFGWVVHTNDGYVADQLTADEIAVELMDFIAEEWAELAE